MQTLTQVIFDLFSQIDYTAVFIMMAIEASFIPFPSEIPMIAVGMQSASSTMHPLVGLTVALGGVWVGTTINYLIGAFIGDKFVEKYGKYFYIKHKDYIRAKELFNKDANFYTFFGRLLPVIRQIISIPAGMAHMPYGRFIGLSMAGSTIWLSILIVLGYFIGQNKEKIHTYSSLISILFIIIFITLFYKKHRKTIMGRRKIKS